MENTGQKELDLQSLQTFFTKEISPSEFAGLLDEFLFEHIHVLTQLLYTDYEGSIHLKTHQFFFYLKTLRDILPECEKV